MRHRLMHSMARIETATQADWLPKGSGELSPAAFLHRVRQVVSPVVAASQFHLSPCRFRARRSGESLGACPA